MHFKLPKEKTPLSLRTLSLINFKFKCMKKIIIKGKSSTLELNWWWKFISIIRISWERSNIRVHDKKSYQVSMWLLNKWFGCKGGIRYQRLQREMIHLKWTRRKASKWLLIIYVQKIIQMKRNDHALTHTCIFVCKN